MYKIELENTTTHQKITYNDLTDWNNGKKLFFNFNIDTTGLSKGEYILSLFDDETIIATDTLKIGDFNNKAIQYNKGNNIYIQ